MAGEKVKMTRIDSPDQVAKGDEVLVKVMSKIPGIPNGEYLDKVTGTKKEGGKEYITLSTTGDVELKPRNVKLLIVAYLVPKEAAPTGGKRRKSRRSTKKSRSTRRR